MTTGYRGTFVISWAQTLVDEVASPPRQALAVGSVWRWHGEAVRVDGADRPLVLAGAEDVEELRRHAAMGVARRVGRAVPGFGVPGRARRAEAPSIPGGEPLGGSGLALTDGRRQWMATLVERPRAAPLLVFHDGFPPAGRRLWITEVFCVARDGEAAGQAPETASATAPALGLAPDALIATPSGPVPVGLLRAGELVLTRDNGPRPVLWIGRRRISGARLVALPGLRPIRLRAGALGAGAGGAAAPDRDLVLAPDHRVVVRGPQARELFGEEEVLVRARDLIDGRRITVDHRAPHARSVHLLLERHEIVAVNGAEVETFHPSEMPLSAIAADERAALLAAVPQLARNPDSYGGHARRPLSPAEAAILLAGGRDRRAIGR